MTEEIKELIEKADKRLTIKEEVNLTDIQYSMAQSLLAIAKILAVALEKGE